MRYKIADIDALREELLKLPEVDDTQREVSKIDAIRRMADVFTELQNRGYSMEMIAKILTDKRLHISVQTLKSYLTRIKPAGRQKQTRRVVASPPKQISVSEPEKSFQVEIKKIPQVDVKVDKELSPVRSSSFIPREDSKDI